MSLPPSMGILIRGWPIAFRNSRRPRKKHAWLTSSVAWSSEMRWVVARSRSESLSRACVGDQVGGGTILAIPNCSTSGRILRKYLNGSDHSCSDGRNVGPSTHLSASSFMAVPWRGRSVRPPGSALVSRPPAPASESAPPPFTPNLYVLKSARSIRTARRLRIKWRWRFGKISLVPTTTVCMSAGKLTGLDQKAGSEPTV